MGRWRAYDVNPPEKWEFLMFSIVLDYGFITWLESILKQDLKTLKA
jgi:hypothetical protein